MDSESIETIANSLREEDYAAYKEYLIKMAKHKHPEGFTIFKEVRKIPKNDGTGNFKYDIKFSDVLVHFMNYLSEELCDKDSNYRSAVFSKIIIDLLPPDDHN